MKTKQEICVPIRDESELQQAKDMLEKNGEKINYELCNLHSYESYNYLQFGQITKDWYMSLEYDLTEIPLSELETVLKGENDGTNAYYSFFKFMSDEYNLTLTDTEMSDIIYEAKKVIEKLKND